MLSDAILFSLAALWFYLAFTFGWQDWRWHLGRIIQSALLGTLTAFLFVLERGDPSAAALALALFFLFALWPSVYERHLLRRLGSGQRFGWIIWLAWRCVVWDRGPWALRWTAQGVALAHSGDSTAAQARFHAVLGGPWWPVTRARYLTCAVLALFRTRRFRDATELFEQYPSVAAAAGADLFFMMARAYAECALPARALACLRQGEERQPFTRGGEMERFLAYVGVFALCGAMEALEERLHQEARRLRLLPAPFAPYWQGVAWLARGEPEKAEQAFGAAVAACAPIEETPWRQAVDFRRDAAEAAFATAQAARVVLAETLERARADAAAAPPRPAPFLFAGRIGPVTAILLAANVVVWALMTIAGSSTDPATLIRFGANLPALVAGSEYWRLVTSMFLHVGLAHLVLNGCALYLFGALIERWCGKREMFVTYMLAGIGGSAASSWLANYAVSAGASGAIFGLLGAAIVLVLRFPSRFPPPLRRRYLFTLIYVAALELLFGATEAGVDNHAHAGGFAVGLAVGLVLRRGWFRKARTALAVALLAALAASTYMSVARARPSNRAPAYLTYLDARLGVELQVPATWQLQPQPNGQVAFIDRQAGAVLTMRAERSPAGEWDESEIPPLLELRRLRLLLSAEEWQGALAEPVTVTFGRRTFHEQWLSRRLPDGRSVVSDRYVAEIQGGLYEFAFECAAPAYPQLRPVLRQVLASFHSLAEPTRFEDEPPASPK